MKKRILSAALCAILTLTVFGVGMPTARAAAAWNESASFLFTGTEGELAAWLNDPASPLEKVSVIQATVNTGDLAAIKQHKDRLTALASIILTVYSGLAIPDDFLSNHQNIQLVDLFGEIGEIGVSAFEGCASLTVVNTYYENQPLYIKSKAFAHCPSLRILYSMAPSTGLNGINGAADAFLQSNEAVAFLQEGSSYTLPGITIYQIPEVQRIRLSPGDSFSLKASDYNLPVLSWHKNFDPSNKVFSAHLHGWPDIEIQSATEDNAGNYYIKAFTYQLNGKSLSLYFCVASLAVGGQEPAFGYTSVYLELSESDTREEDYVAETYTPGVGGGFANERPVTVTGLPSASGLTGVKDNQTLIIHAGTTASLTGFGKSTLSFNRDGIEKVYLLIPMRYYPNTDFVPIPRINGYTFTEIRVQGDYYLLEYR